jgi:hypothetical protein
MNTLFRVGVASTVIAAAASLSQARQPDIRSGNDLKQIGLAYYNCIDVNGRPPARAQDLAAHLGNDKRLRKLLETEAIVFFYNVRPTQKSDGASSTVLAYPDYVPKKGGFVLMGDGTVQKMTVEDFRKAPRAGQAKTK